MPFFRTSLAALVIILSSFAAIAQQSDLGVTKSGSDSAAADTDVTYQIQAVNNGPNSAPGVSLTDQIPAGLEFVSLSSPAGFNCTTPAVGTGGTITCTISDFDAGAIANFTLVLHVPPQTAGGTTFTNTATISGDTSEPNSQNNEGTWSFTTYGSDLSVTKTGPDSAAADTDVAFQIQAINSGPATAPGVTLTDPIPAGLEFVSLTSPAGFNCLTPAVGTGGTVTCTISNFEAGAIGNFTLVLHVPANTPPGTTFTNIATISADTFDPNDENNQGTWSFTTNGGSLADLAAQKSGPSTALPNTDVSFIIAIANNGPAPATDVNLTDNLPAGTTFVSYSQTNGPVFTCTAPAVGNGGTFSCSIATLGAGVSASFTLTVHIPEGNAEYTNLATVTSSTPDPNGENNQGVTTLIVSSADVSITKMGPGSVNAGAPIAWTITVINAGQDPASSIFFSDPLPAGTSFVSLVQNNGPTGTCNTPAVGSNGSVSCSLELLGSGSSAQFTLTALTAPNAANGSTISNTATVTSQSPDPDSTNNTSTAISTVTTSADLSVTKTDSPDPVNAGANLTYTLTVTNNGPSDAQNLSLSDTLPPNTTLVSFTVPAGWTRTDAVPVGGTGTVTATAPNLSAGANAVFTLVVNVNSNLPASIISNTASIAAATADPNSENNSQTATTTVAASPDLTISKTHEGNFTAGQAGSYTITVTNSGLGATSGTVTVTDTVPVVLTPTAPIGAHNGWTCSIVSQTLTCTRGDVLAPGGSYPSITLTVNVINPAPLTVTNTATVSGGGEFETSNNTASDVTNINCSQDVSLNNTSPLVISRFRENGPGGSRDEFVEIFNPSNSPHTVASGTCTGGYGVFASAGNGTSSNTVSMVCQIPNGTVIPARGYYLCTGSGYTLGDLGRNGGSSTAEGDSPIGCNGNCAAEIPNDAGLALINVGTNTVVNTAGGFDAASVPGGAFIVFDKVGFAPYGAGAPASAYPSLAGNFCEGTCLQPVGDASTLPTCTNPTELFPLAPDESACYGQSGQYEVLRRQTLFNGSTGTLHQDTNSNTADLLLVSPNPAINTGLNRSGVAGVKGVLGAAAPHDSTAPADFPTTTLSRTPFDAGPQTGPRNSERLYSLDPVASASNNPEGTYSLRFKYTNNSLDSITALRFSIDDLSTLCGPQTASPETGTAEARNLSPSPNCQNGNTFSAILKVLNSNAEVVVDSTGTAQSVKGTVIEDTSVVGSPIPAPGALSPLGGGIDNSLVVNPSAVPASVGDGVNGGTGVFATTVNSGGSLRVKLKFGVVRNGRFIILVVPMGKTGAPMD